MASTLRERRKHAGLTQQALADLVGASRAWVRALEAGCQPESSPTRERIERVLDQLEREHRSGGQRLAREIDL